VGVPVLPRAALSGAAGATRKNSGQPPLGQTFRRRFAGARHDAGLHVRPPV